MSFSLLPNVILHTVSDISSDKLRLRGIRLLMLDFDNTIVPYTTSVPEKHILVWIEEMQRSGIMLCIVSNSKKGRVLDFCEKYGLDCITHAKKPFKRGIIDCLKKYDVQYHEAAIVGDQIFTDTLGGNRCGLTTILVSAINNHSFWLKLRHIAELPFIFLARNRRNI